MKQMKQWKAIPFTHVDIQDEFWRPRLRSVSEVTLPACLHQCEATGRIDNFRKAAGQLPGHHQGMYYDDSDVYKVLEGAAYSLMNHRDEALEERIDGIIAAIAAAQEADGYLSTSYTLEAPEAKWSDMEKHEMYNGGHLIEAATAYYEATGKRQLLEVACRLADHYDRIFGPGKRHWVEGHEEIELALLKLFRVTGETRYRDFALWLLEERGHGHGAGAIWDKPEWGPAYCQDDVPVRDIHEVKGHAVRAMYLYTAMADMVNATGDGAYVAALDRVWRHTTERNMYLTGGIGPSQENEGFTFDYDLPNESAYCETCAAIAMVFWNQRMNLLHGAAPYADVMERCMYNGALSGISLTGDRFFYVNPLASQGGHHRTEWFHTSCCPTNLVRFLPSIGGYQYAATGRGGLAVNLYMAGTATALPLGEDNRVGIRMDTKYPYAGSVDMELSPEKAEVFSLHLRIPGWCQSFSVAINGVAVPLAEQGQDGVGGVGGVGVGHKGEDGYLVLERLWSAGDRVRLVLDMPVAAVHAHPEVTANHGRFALQRGPLVYCLEQADNSTLAYDAFELDVSQAFAIEERPDVLGGVTVLSGHTASGAPCSFIPYYAWDNREAGFMQVWVKQAAADPLYSRS